MISKEVIINNFEKDLDKLFAEIERYHTELTECKLILVKREIELEHLKKELKFEKEKNKTLSSKKVEKQNLNVELKDKKSSEDLQADELTLQSMVEDPQFVLKQNDITIVQVLEFIGETLESRNKDYSNECYYLALKLLNSLYYSSVKNQVEEFFRYKHSSFEGNVYERFSLPLILELLKSYLLYGKRNELLDIYLDTINDFDYFSSEKINSLIFSKFLWYGVYLENEKEFINCCKDTTVFLNEDRAEVVLYPLVLEMMQNKDVSKDYKIKIENLLNEITDLDSSEKEIIFNFIKKKLLINLPLKMHDKEMVNSKISTKNTPMFNTVHFLEDTNENNGFREKEILFAIYHNLNKSSSPKNYFVIKAFIKPNDQKAYVNREQVLQIIKLRKGGWANVEGYPLSTIINKKQVNIMNSKLKINNDLFKWPTTEIIQNNNLESTNSNDFLNTTSELAKLGYRITGLNREKRWNVLQTAVPKLGLKRVANIIAYNVRLRKKQKNGAIKNSYSIGEWEYDLGRLKSKYYKNEFVWPKLD
ncbi:hypothetical protein [Fictibacillus arsenicus]|uniref:Uncharacterized protein n=1 Tax=Fictibacillus arsenicus TaxID=255247 RepID=A0A1V3G7W3_9BACL|nr:hypothetical protein [Fictibacillus arsenicus]OOE12491.1 hypothetical protein UN64_10420 [Fictibacillus arsenicus]